MSTTNSPGVSVPDVDGLRYENDDNFRSIYSPEYNMVFNKTHGIMARWGKTLDDDAVFCPYGPEIIDLEIAVNGCPNRCAFCYKSNDSGSPRVMSMEMLGDILDRLPFTVCTIALGITNIGAIPDFEAVLRLIRDHDIIPTFTVSGLDNISDDLIDMFGRYVGSVSVSVHDNDPKMCYTTAMRIRERVQQTNLHLVVSEGRKEFCQQVIAEAPTSISALVMLMLKPKGRAKEMGDRPASSETVDELIGACLERSINIGFDSCTSDKASRSLKSRGLDVSMLCEPCESSLFSAYINIDGELWFCSFAEGEEQVEPVNVLAHDSFYEVWSHSNTVKFRNRVLDCGRNCPVWEL